MFNILCRFALSLIASLHSSGWFKKMTTTSCPSSRAFFFFSSNFLYQTQWDPRKITGQHETLYCSQINSFVLPLQLVSHLNEDNRQYEVIGYNHGDSFPGYWSIQYRYTNTVLISWMEHYFLPFFEDDCSKPKLKASLMVILHDGLCGLLLFIFCLACV